MHSTSITITCKPSPGQMLRARWEHAFRSGLMTANGFRKGSPYRPMRRALDLDGFYACHPSD